ncbi:MAG: hypothetical protein ACO1PI_04445 [Bacteroidota bacterium]
MEKNAKLSIDAILEPINERLKAPFTGAFFISFLFLNWKIFILILTFDYKKDIGALFEIIENKYLSIYNVLYYPLLSALSYIIIAPLTSSLFLISKEFFIKKLKNKIVLLIQNSKPISYEEYKKVIDKNLLLRTEILDINIKITSLTEKKL